MLTLLDEVRVSRSGSSGRAIHWSGLRSSRVASVTSSRKVGTRSGRSGCGIRRRPTPVRLIRVHWTFSASGQIVGIGLSFPVIESSARPCSSSTVCCLHEWLGFPDKPNPFIPMMQQLPQRYRDLFREGCCEVLMQPKPTRLSGAVRHGTSAELYRAAFMPLGSGDPARPLIFGTFNRRVVPLSAFQSFVRPEHLKLIRPPVSGPCQKSRRSRRRSGPVSSLRF